MKNILLLIICNFFILICFSQANKKNGEYKEYYENGKLKIVSNYKDGKLEGELKEYDENGNLKNIRYFKNGEELKPPPPPPKEEVDSRKEQKGFLDPSMEAQFNGDWRSYVQRTIERSIDDLMDDGRAGTCEVLFVVAEDGTISDVEALTMKGTVLARVAVDAIERGPKWRPGVNERGQPVASKRIQKVTFVMPLDKDEEEVKRYYESGQLKRICKFKNGLPEGEWKEYYENGQLQVFSFFKNGVEEGETKWYYENGQLSSIGYYKNGKLEGESKLYNDIGRLKLISNFKDGKLEGESMWYYENGQLQAVGFYKDNKLDGAYKTFYENGQLQVIGYYKDDKREGEFKWYSENGKLENTGYYKNDEEIK